MKKVICMTLVLLVTIGTLTACSFTQNASGALAGAAESTPKVEEMMAALAENRTEDAKALMHPEATEKRWLRGVFFPKPKRRKEETVWQSSNLQPASR